MKGDDPLEQRLRHIPRRQIPAAWREHILNAAMATTVAARLGNPAPSTLWDQRAWAALGLVWLLIIGLQLSFLQSDRTAPHLGRTSTVSSPQFLETLRQQERVLTELAEFDQLSPRAATLPKPRSQGMQKQANA